MERDQQRWVQVCLKSAIGELLRNDLDLLRLDVNERSITHKLAGYLQKGFPDWDVDCEYNRNHDQVKQLRFPQGQVRPDDTDAKTVFPDIIVHKRNSDGNLLVIEVKKTTNPENGDYDSEKLRAFRSELGYKHAAFVRLRTGKQKPGADPIQWF